MIRDIIINTNSGIPIFHQNFGDCHSIDTDINLFSGFLGAIQMLSQKLTEEHIQLIEMKEKKLAFHKTKINTYAIICDSEDKKESIHIKLTKIAEIFEVKYRKNLESFLGNVNCFENFGDMLIELKITNKNCGGRPECKGCPNSSKSLPLQNYISQIERKTSLISRIREKLKIF